MSRQTKDSDAWHIVIDKETNEIITYHPASQPELSKGKSNRRRYDEIGVMNRREDAEHFRQYKEMGIKPDAVAYLGFEHVITSAVENGTQVHYEKLMEMAASVRKETGRVCFGNCRSLECAPACATCFASLNQTWRLCACVRCLVPEDVAADFWAAEKAKTTPTE